MTLADRLGAALGVSDRRPLLLAGDEGRLSGGDAMAAAVLVAVTDRPEPGVILTKRTEHLRRHAGQIAFPGGRIDPDDADPTAAALREAEEEIALPPALVTVVGEVDEYVTGTGYHITPVLGVVPPGLTLRPSEAEVAAVFEVPLAFLLDTGNHRQGSLDDNGRQRRFFEIHWGERRIWGVTAALIVNLSRRLQWTG